MLLQPGQLSVQAACASHRVGSGPLPSLLHFLPVYSHSLLFLSQINQGCVAAGAVWTPPSVLGVLGNGLRPGRASERHAFPAAPGGRLRASERLSCGCLKGVMSAPSDVGSGHKEVKSGCKKQLAEAENRFNIVTLTMYLIDISLFVM